MFFWRFFSGFCGFIPPDFQHKLNHLANGIASYTIFTKWKLALAGG